MSIFRTLNLYDFNVPLQELNSPAHNSAISDHKWPTDRMDLRVAPGPDNGLRADTCGISHRDGQGWLRHNLDSKRSFAIG